MPALNFLNLLAISSIAIIAASFGPVPANAVSSNVHNVARHAHGHDILVKRIRPAKRAAQRCKPRSSPKPSASAPANKPNTPNGGGGPPARVGPSKFGLAWPNGPYDLPKWQGNGFSYTYMWGPNPPSNSKSLGFIPMPMFRGRESVSDFEASVAGPARAGHRVSDYVLAFNEPNQPYPAGCDMSPQEGADLFRSHIQFLSNLGVKIASPAPSSAPSGFTWIKDFLRICAGQCHLDYIAIHYYDIRFEDFKVYAEKFMDEFKLPIMVTEYACQNYNGGAQASDGEVWTFHQRVRDFCKNDGRVFACFPFGAMHDMQGVNPANQLMDGSGGPNGLGNLYLHG